MTREIFTTKMPTEPGMYYVRYLRDDIDEVAFLAGTGKWYAFGNREAIDFSAPVYSGATFGPRIPSPESLAGDAGKETKRGEKA